MIGQHYVSLMFSFAAVSSSLTVLSNSQVHVASTGESVHLQCLFLADNFNLFDYPVLWRKAQLDDDVQVDDELLTFDDLLRDHQRAFSPGPAV